MTRVHYVKSARKSYGDIKRGEPYYWWKFRRGPKQRSRIQPTRSQLTQSSFWSQLYSIQESLDADPEDVPDAISSLRDELLSLRDETEEKVDNAPESLKNSPTAELLNGRIEALDEAISTLEGLTDGGEWSEVIEAVEGISCE